MNTLEETKRAVRALSPDDFVRFRQWFDELDARAWDEQIERDILEGKLDALGDEALKDFDPTTCREL